MPDNNSLPKKEVNSCNKQAQVRSLLIPYNNSLPKNYWFLVGTLFFRITSCEPPSIMLVEDTTVSLAFF